MMLIVMRNAEYGMNNQKRRKQHMRPDFCLQSVVPGS